ncbi:Asx homology domain-containing protein [Biscogniauxia marginata]|nr:Asx homology domain-containing protein [Biscogniauxia marginata]
MPRKKNAGRSRTPLSAPLEPTRRSTRSRKKPSVVTNASSEDELAVQNLAALQSITNPATQEVQDEIVAYPPSKKEDPQEHIADTTTVHKTQNHHEVKETNLMGCGFLKNTGSKRRSVGDDEDELVDGTQPAVKKPKVIIKQSESRPMGTKRGKSKWDDPEEMLTNPNAPLAKAKLRNLLCSSRAWDILSTEEKQQILSKFPDQQEILEPGTEDARPNVASLRNNNNFRHDVARYQEDLAQGRHDPEWIRQALAAHRKRELGLYNVFLERRFVEDWGMKMLSRPSQTQAGPGRAENGELAGGRDGSGGSPKVSGSVVDESGEVKAAAKARVNGEEGTTREETETMGGSDVAGTGPADEAHGSIQVHLGEPADDVSAIATTAGTAGTAEQSTT